jgi:hypothetical protein
MKLISKIILGMAAVTLCPSVGYANGNKAESKYFSAEIANIRRANTGNVIVTIKFVPKIEEPSNLYIYSDIEKNFEDNCRNNRTQLIDGNGDEHAAQNCLPAFKYGNSEYTDGMQIHAGSEAVFVYKFGLAGASLESLKNMNITIPMRYMYCDRQSPPDWITDKNTWRGNCSASPETLSFYDVNAN